MKPKSWYDGVLGQYFRESTIHGVKYIGMKDRHFSERILWIIAVLCCLGYSFYLVAEQYQKYHANPVIISFQPRETAIAQIPFPAITICNINILKKNIMLEILSKLETSKKKREGIRDAMVLSEHLSHYCLAASSFRRISNSTKTEGLQNNTEEDFVRRIDQLIHELGENSSNIDSGEKSRELREQISAYKHKGMHNCEDMIIRCLWARETVNCSSLFYPIYTSHGSCCVFNMMPNYMLRNLKPNDRHTVREMARLNNETIAAWDAFKQDDLIQDPDKAEGQTYPKNQKSGGKPYGLSILINPEMESYGSCNTNDGFGFKIIAHSPISYPNIADYGVIAPIDSEVFINVNPEATTASEKDLYNTDLSKRSCYFPSDDQSKLESYRFYTSDNCMDECIARVTYKNCTCLRYFMPRNETQQLCGASNLKCSEDVRQNLTNTGRKGHCSMCRPACTEIKYKMQVSQFPLRDSGSPVLYNTSTELNKTATKSSIVHIYIGTDSFYSKERKRLYDFSDLIANAGGLLGLCLGFSIISLVEILYFFTMRAWFQHKSDKEAEEDEDFYSRSSENNRPKLSAIVRPRVIQGLQNNSVKELGYTNWAMQATNSIARVDVSSLATSFPVTRSRLRRAPEFDLLSGSNGKWIYPPHYLS